MEAKSIVVKSRSSNSAKTLKSEYINKKSRSNADFPPDGALMKKRGVYVEPNRLRMNKLEKNQGQDRPKAPRRPPPGNKKFLASVLTILSKSTTGTQYPDKTEPSRRRTKKETKTPKREPVNEGIVDNKDRMKITTDDTEGKENAKPKNKPKYRSKALNDEVDKEFKKKPFVVLQSQKEIVQTPSIYSENDSFNWSNLPSLVKKAQQQNKEIEKKAEEINNELATQIMEGRRIRSDKRVRIDEPMTLVADLTLTKKTENIMEANGKLYNFFVDLLETTINVYKPKDDFSKPKDDFSKTPNVPSEASSTKMPLEMNESVANKLHVPSEKREKPEATSQPSQNPCCCLKELEICNIPSPEPKNKMPLKPKKRTEKTQYMTESFSFMRKPAPKKLTAASVIETKKKTTSRKQKKKTLLNLFKEQLKMDDSEFNEPRNLYQALKVMAENKRRCQKTIHFEEKLRKREKRQDGLLDCMFKRRKVISPSTKETYKNPRKVAPSIRGGASEYNEEKRASECSTDLEDHSYHSLEVYGYDYEAPSVKKGKEVLVSYHSTPSYSFRIMGSNDMLDFSDTDSMCFY